MSDDKYILDKDGNVQPCNSLMEWAEWFEKSGTTRVIARTTVGPYDVSTVFLSLGYSFTGGKPVLFETMTFYTKPVTKKILGKKWTGHVEAEDLDGDGFDRYHTKAEALAGHERIVNSIKAYLNAK